MTVKFTNNASATLATSLTNTATSISLTSGQGSYFPALTGGDWFYATLVNASNNLEIVKVTARASDLLTVVRGAEGTTALAWSAGDKCELRPTAAGFNDIYTAATAYTDTASASTNSTISTHISNPTAAHAATAISNTPAGGIAATTVQAAINELDTEKADKTTAITGSAGITATGTLGSGISVSPTSGYNGYGARTVSTAAPTGGSDGDIWYKV